ncbi:hypothetical protein AHAS_Ahas06G0100500 [Arachis hypogaea]
MPISKTVFISATLFSSLVAAAAYYQNISPTSLGFVEEKLTHIRFYFHDVVTGPNATIIISISPLMGKSKAPLPFGSLVMLEDPLTVGPEPDSKLIGKAQGFYTMVTQREDIDLELVMGMTITFTEGKFNGSTLSLFGRNSLTPLERCRSLVEPARSDSRVGLFVLRLTQWIITKVMLLWNTTCTSSTIQTKALMLLLLKSVLAMALSS